MKRTLWWDQRVPIEIDSDDFEIIKLMVLDTGAATDISKWDIVIDALIKQGYDKYRAKELVILARKDLRS